MIKVGLTKPGKWREEFNLSYSIIALIDLIDEVRYILDVLEFEMKITRVLGPGKTYAELSQLYFEVLGIYSNIGDHIDCLAKKSDENMLFTITIGKEPKLVG